MSVTVLKQALKTILSGVGGIGYLDLNRIDPDDLPRAYDRKDKKLPYWGLALAGGTDTIKAMGGPPTQRVLDRTYELQLEGYLGIVATVDHTEFWETLVGDRIPNRLELSGTTAPARAGVVRSPVIEHISWHASVLRHHDVRWHYGRINFSARVYLLINQGVDDV